MGLCCACWGRVYPPTGTRYCLFCIATYPRPPTHSYTTELTDSFELNAWASTIEPSALAQALSVNGSALEAGFTNDTGAFIAYAPDAVPDASHPVPPQTNPLWFFFPMLSNNQPEAVAANGTFGRIVDSSRFPAATDMAGTLLYMAPRSMRTPHWHLGIDEWQFVISGRVEERLFLRGTNYSASVLGAGDVGFAPMGFPHYLFNPSYTEPVLIVLIFNGGDVTNMELATTLGTVAPAVAAASLGTTQGFVESINYGDTVLVATNASLVY